MLKKYDKVAYIITLSLLSVFVLMSCFPALSAVGGFVTPPVALFVGLVYALLFGKPFASFNKKMSKVLLQYSVVGLGFGMNLYESLASGGSGMLWRNQSGASGVHDLRLDQCQLSMGGCYRL